MPRILILAVTVVAISVSLLLPATSNAAVPCRDRIYNDWYHDGKIASSYSTACYRDALKHIPTDAKFYSSLETDIRSAMLASFRIHRGAAAPKQVGHGLAAIGHGAPGTPELVSAQSSSSNSHDQTLGGTQTTAGAPVAGTSSNGTPLPILVLGGVALALAAAGAVGTGVRFARRRHPGD